jgi:hypothetical protein
MVIAVLSSDSDRSHKEAIFLLNIIGSFCKLLPTEGESFAQVQNWLLKVCTEHSLSTCALSSF